MTVVASAITVLFPEEDGTGLPEAEALSTGLADPIVVLASWRLPAITGSM